MGRFETNFFTIEEMAEGVYGAVIKRGTGAWANAGIVNLGEETLVFDTFSTPSAADSLRHAAEELTGNKVAYVINSHFHGDHVNGNQVFSDSVIISTSKTREIMAGMAAYTTEELIQAYENHIRDLEKQRSRQRKEVLSKEFLTDDIEEKNILIRELPSLKLALPMLQFQNSLELVGSKRKVQLLSYGGGHTASDAFLYLPDDKIAFTGDLVAVNTHPAVGNGNVGEWIAILDKLLALDIQLLLPGHGTISTKDNISVMRRYLEWLQEAVKEHVVTGGNLEELYSKPLPTVYSEWLAWYVYEWNLDALFKIYKTSSS